MRPPSNLASCPFFPLPSGLDRFQSISHDHLMHFSGVGTNNIPRECKAVSYFLVSIESWIATAVRWNSPRTSRNGPGSLIYPEAYTGSG